MQYKELASLYDVIEQTSKRIEKSKIISAFLQECKKEELCAVVYLIQGRVFPQWDERKLGMSSKLIVKTIAKVSGESQETIEKEWSRVGDLGLVAEKLLEKKKQSTLFRSSLSIKKVIDNVRKLSTLEGSGTVNKKIDLISELLSSASGLEARYIVRTVIEALRTGVGDSMVRDALVETFCVEREDKEAFKAAVEQVQGAFNVSNDFGVLALSLQEKGLEGLKDVTLTVGKPLKVMLFPKANSTKEGFEIVGKPAIIEPKLDGFRVQVHRRKDEIKLFTRRLDEVTTQFPDVVKLIKEHVRSKDIILDTEVVGIDAETKKFVPFQAISQRIRRKHDIHRLVKELPIMVTVFDLMELNGENMLDQPLSERKKKLKAVIKGKKKAIEIIDHIVTKDEEKAEKYYLACLDQGHEGVMMKSVEGVYKPGKRVGQGVKVKPTMESLDLVIVAAEWGEGKRAKWLSSFTVACRDGDSLKTIGKVGTGIKEKSEEGVSFQELTDALKKLILEEKGKRVTVVPKIILEIIYEEIQQSPSYNSGFALRFPRVHRLREDKGIKEISTIEEIKTFYHQQTKR